MIDIKKELEKIEREKVVVSNNMSRIVDEVIKNNTKAVKDYHGGKKTTLGFLIGQVMQSTKGVADPREVKDMLIVKLNENKSNAQEKFD